MGIDDGGLENNENSPVATGFQENNVFGQVEFAIDDTRDPAAERHIDRLVNQIEEKGGDVLPWVRQYFDDKGLYNALPESLRKDDNELKSYIENTNNFAETIHRERVNRNAGDTSGLLGEKVGAVAKKHEDGSDRPVGVGYKLNLEALRKEGIDPKKVLFFRVTQPSDEPKPEYFWTSDLFETQRGLTREISPERRESAIILVSDIETISENRGLIQDINDDNGLSVEQIGTEPFDQSRCLAVIQTSKKEE